MTALTLAEIQTLLEAATRAVPGSLRPETALAGLPGWDSLGLVQFLADVADRSGVRLEVAELRGAATVAALAELIARRAAGSPPARDQNWK
ncbi:MAG: acyl carrier protein [Planctomycetota bacterium]